MLKDRGLEGRGIGVPGQRPSVTVSVLGSGEAFDGEPHHTSLLVRTRETSLLLDCGAFVPRRVWEELSGGEQLDGLWVSHFHADHLFGIPLLVGRMWEEGRRRPLALVGGEGLLGRVETLLDLGYPGLRSRLEFELDPVLVEPGNRVRWRDLSLRTAETVHPVRNLAVRIEIEGSEPLAYSGDGRPTAASIELGTGAHWVHECFTVSQAPPGHADLETLVEALRQVGPKRLGLVHTHRAHREELARRAKALASEGLPVEVLAPGQSWAL